jgi:fumarate reductase flavoprotein subunit
MRRDQKPSADVSRRDFIKTAAAGASVAITAGSGAVGERLAAREAAAESPKYSFEVPPPPILQEQIKAAITADVVVVGAGTAGLPAALSAAQQGAKVVLIDKHTTYSARGGDNTAIGSRLQKQLGIKLDVEEIVRVLMKWGGNKPDERLIRLWAVNCGKVMDWIIDMTDAAGLHTNLYYPTTTGADAELIDKWPTPTGFPPGWSYRDENYIEYPTDHRWNNAINQRLMLGVLESNARKRGVDIYYSTRAAQLLRGAKGRVTGVLAETNQGDYVQFNANKAIVLCTGDYGSNPEMMQKYCPQAAALASSRRNMMATGGPANLITPQNMLPKAVNTGDGHLMAMQIGAVMEPPPHAPMAHMSGVMGADAFLRVNKYGERFGNEDVEAQSLANQCLQQGGFWTVFDDSWEEDAPKMGPGFFRIVRVNDKTRAQFQTKLKSGALLQANTIGELAGKMNVPLETLRAVIERYNELAKLGKDLDFGKRGDRLTAIDKPPFYAGWSAGPGFFVVLGGLVVNTKLQPLDANGNVIAGLYLAGNTVGRRFANDYPVLLPGLSHSMAWTHGYLAGKYAAAEKGPAIRIAMSEGVLPYP